MRSALIAAALVASVTATTAAKELAPSRLAPTPAAATATVKPAKPPKTMTVIYNEIEAMVMLRMLDLAVRQGGLAMAGNAAVLAGKIKDAAKAQGLSLEPPPPKQQEPNQ